MKLRRALAWLIVCAAALCAGLALRTWVIRTVRVQGRSMSPTLNEGDTVLVTRFDYLASAPARRDVVQLKVPGRDGTYLKRVIALPGEHIEIKDGSVWIDGQLLSEDYAGASEGDISVTLGGDEYFVMGDNRAESSDSREVGFGAVSAACFLGRVRAVLWPFERFGPIAHR